MQRSSCSPKTTVHQGISGPNFPPRSLDFPVQRPRVGSQNRARPIAFQLFNQPACQQNWFFTVRDSLALAITLDSFTGNNRGAVAQVAISNVAAYGTVRFLQCHRRHRRPTVRGADLSCWGAAIPPLLRMVGGLKKSGFQGGNLPSVTRRQPSPPAKRDMPWCSRITRLSATKTVTEHPPLRSSCGGPTPVVAFDAGERAPILSQPQIPISTSTRPPALGGSSASVAMDAPSWAIPQVSCSTTALQPLDAQLPCRCGHRDQGTAPAAEDHHSMPRQSRP